MPFFLRLVLSLPLLHASLFYSFLNPFYLCKPLLSNYRLCSFPCAQAENENGFLYMFIVLPFALFLKGKEPEKRKIRTIGKMKTAPSSLCLIVAPPSPVFISLALFSLLSH